MPLIICEVSFQGSGIFYFKCDCDGQVIDLVYNSGIGSFYKPFRPPNPLLHVSPVLHHELHWRLIDLADQIDVVRRFLEVCEDIHAPNCFRDMFEL